MSRKQLWVVLGTGVIIGAGGIAAVVLPFLFHKWRDPPVLALPANDEVAEMRARLAEFGGFGPAVPEFTIPPEHVPIVLSWIRPGEYVRHPRRLDPTDNIGEVVIRTKLGNHLRLQFYWSGNKCGAVITPDGVDQFFGRSTNDRGGEVDGGLNHWFAIKRAYDARS